MKSTLAVIAVLFSMNAFAGVCAFDDSTLKNAEEQVRIVQNQFDVGMVNTATLLQAKNVVLELKLCNNSEDYASFEALAENSVSILAQAKAIASIGSATTLDVAMAQTKVSGLKAICPTVQATVQNSYDIGTATTADLETVKKACAALH